MEPLRVRQILSHMHTPEKMALKKLLPKGLKMPDAETERYPSALLGVLPKEEAYAILGCIAEELLRLPVASVNMDALETAMRDYWSDEDTEFLSAVAAVRKSKTTEPFLDLLRQTRVKMIAAVREPLQYDQVLTHGMVQGHPDAINTTQVFEVKLTGLLKKGWTDFLLQTFAYAALQPSVRDVYIVLPLQQTVWHHCLDGWMGRKAYGGMLNTVGKRIAEAAVADVAVGQLLREMYFIGFHAPKQKTLMDTIQSFPDYKKPYQIFLGGPQNSQLRIEDGELAAAGSLVAEKGVNLYVHSQYIINLCTSGGGGDNWNVSLLKKNLQYAAAIGCKGVVVHVGKSTTAAVPAALETMRKNIVECLEDATEECPLLLETPAGQGTETLTGVDDFLGFVTGINDPRLRICLDTCHVFACGHKPIDYLGKFEVYPGLLKLVHYNDSAAPCGSCVDRHAFMGTGHIGMEGMKQIAELCHTKQVPMVIE
jgi:deoxyribonuclease-4